MIHDKHELIKRIHRNLEELPPNPSSIEIRVAANAVANTAMDYVAAKLNEEATDWVRLAEQTPEGFPARSWGLLGAWIRVLANTFSPDVARFFTPPVIQWLKLTMTDPGSTETT